MTQYTVYTVNQMQATPLPSLKSKYIDMENLNIVTPTGSVKWTKPHT